MTTALPLAVEQALAAAVRAPSPHNTQPWRFVVDGPRIEVWLDRNRVLTVADPAAREARLSCGAAAYNLVLMLRVNGFGTVLRVLPDPAERDLLAVIRLDGDCRPATPDRRLAEAVFRRHTNRRPLSARPVSAPARFRLRSAALAEGGLLEFLDASGRYSQVTALARQAEAVQAGDAGFRAESARWTGREPESPDGVPTAAFGPPPEVAMVIPLRSSHENDAIPARSFEQDPCLAVVLTREHGFAADVRAGLVLQRVLLTATADGLATSCVSQPFETAVTRRPLLELFREIGQPHTLVRIGHGLPVRMTARRPAADVTTVRTAPRTPVR
ncbi:Acg family FMN-binding oxidoreductase [Amycolatopsis sp. NPDC051903]|uniref:Acg family FMN-binding oxidoreductase n=1 Tax=Amycolatopsis sp. NPDC051903 TaxID=3363936 RepID=UPI00378CF12E